MGLLKLIVVPSATAVVAAVIAAYYAYLITSKELDIPRDGWFGSGRKRPDDVQILPFKVAVAEATLTDLKNRLNNTRISHKVLEDADSFEYGFNANYLKTVVEYWKNDFDWRKQEKIINTWPQFTTEIEGMKVHFYHAKPTENKYKKVIPLLLVHGWPGNVFEFHKLLPMLLDPLAHNLTSTNDIAFEVIAPSIPGFGFSSAPKKRGFSPIAAARVFKKLMDLVGHKRETDNNCMFYQQGGDWGAVITAQLSRMYPESVNGLHINMATAIPFASVQGLFYTIVGSVIPKYLFANPRHHEYTWTQAVKQLALQESGYMHLQATKPDTIGIGLNDSPVALAAYILEKFSVWTNPEHTKLSDGGLTKKFSLDELLTIITIYWTQGNIVPSQRIYREFFTNEMEFWLTFQYISVPTGHAQFPHEIFDKQPAEIIATSFNLTTQRVMPDGGHFGAFEQPSLLASHFFEFVSDIEKK